MYDMKIRLATMAWTGYTMQAAKRHSQGAKGNSAPPHLIAPSILIADRGACDFRLHDGHDPITCALKPSPFSMR